MIIQSILYAVGEASGLDPVSPGRDYITTGGAIIMTMLTAIAGVLVSLIQSNRKLTRRGMEAAETAADRTEKTGNGFAATVTAALARIELTQRELTRDLGGIREEQRTERVERLALAQALSLHIERNDT